MVDYRIPLVILGAGIAGLLALMLHARFFPRPIEHDASGVLWSIVFAVIAVVGLIAFIVAAVIDLLP
jgi:hypothetical protein